MKLLQGILIGIGIGILIAPDKGSETRKILTGKLSNFGDDASDYLSDAADNIKSKAGNIVDNVKTTTKRVTSKVKSKAEDIDDAADDL